MVLDCTKLYNQQQCAMLRLIEKGTSSKILEDNVISLSNDYNHNLNFFRCSINKKNNPYIAISTDTVQIGALKECPFSNPHEEIKNNCKTK